jgi:hypothetical protein
MLSPSVHCLAAIPSVNETSQAGSEVSQASTPPVKPPPKFSRTMWCVLRCWCCEMSSLPAFLSRLFVCLGPLSCTRRTLPAASWGSGKAANACCSVFSGTCVCLLIGLGRKEDSVCMGGGGRRAVGFESRCSPLTGGGWAQRCCCRPSPHAQGGDAPSDPTRQRVARVSSERSWVRAGLGLGLARPPNLGCRMAHPRGGRIGGRRMSTAPNTAASSSKRGP